MRRQRPIYIIAAVAADGAVGSEGRLPWNLPDDRAWFAMLTTAAAPLALLREVIRVGGAPPGAQAPNLLVCGQRTWDSVTARAAPRPPLAGRQVCLLTHDIQRAVLRRPHQPTLMATSMAGVAQVAETVQARHVYAIGGAGIWRLAMLHPDWDPVLILTEVDTVVPEADTFFPGAETPARGAAWHETGMLVVEGRRWTRGRLGAWRMTVQGLRYRFTLWTQGDLMR